MNGEKDASQKVMLFFTLLISGIDVVRNKIKVFAQKKVTLPPGRHKIIILDEADRYAIYLLCHVLEV